MSGYISLISYEFDPLDKGYIFHIFKIMHADNNHVNFFKRMTTEISFLCLNIVYSIIE
jgi:hypothetical protein